MVTSNDIRPESELTSYEPPWTSEKWMKKTEIWIHKQLKLHDYEECGQLEIIRKWSISCIIRAKTSKGFIYFKASSAQFIHEPVITQMLSHLFPHHIAPPLAINKRLGWMLLPDFGRSLNCYPTLSLWEKAINELAAIQIDSIKQIGSLKKAKCPNHMLGWLQHQIATLLIDTNIRDILSTDQYQKLVLLIPKLQLLCSTLDAFNIPPTIVHGDLHAENVAVQDGKITLFDWTDACISHPFLDVVTFLEEGNTVLDSSEARELLQRAYLTQWRTFEEQGRLDEALEIAKTIGKAFQIVNYTHVLRNEQNTKRDLLPDLQFWLNELLK